MPPYTYITLSITTAVCIQRPGAAKTNKIRTRVSRQIRLHSYKTEAGVHQKAMGEAGLKETALDPTQVDCALHPTLLPKWESQ